MCWSDYKYHSTIKYLIEITPSSAISYISNSYGGRASDSFIVKNSGVLNFIQPGDQVMADRGRVAWWLATCARKSKVPRSSPAASYVQR